MPNTYPTWCQLKGCYARLTDADRAISLEREHVFRGTAKPTKIKMHFCSTHRTEQLLDKKWSLIS